MVNMEIYVNSKLTEYELYAVNNEIDKIKLLNLDEICEDDLIDKIFFRACENNNIHIVNYLLPFVNNLEHGLYACLYFEHIEIATIIFDNLCISEELINSCKKKFESQSLLEVLFVLNKYKSIDFMLNAMFDFTFNTSCSKINILYPYPILAGIKKNSFESIKVFIDNLIKKNEHEKLIIFCELEKHHAFYTACKNNYVDLARYLCTVFPFYSILIENDIIIQYDVNYDKYVIQSINKKID